jgi:site-specific DNA-cytosine methylase
VPGPPPSEPLASDAEEHAPPMLMWENVPELLARSQAIGFLVTTMEDLGYRVAYRTLARSASIAFVLPCARLHVLAGPS